MEEVTDMDVDRPAPVAHDSWHLLLPILVSTWRDTLPWTAGLRAPMVLTCRKFHDLWPMYNVRISPSSNIYVSGYAATVTSDTHSSNGHETIGPGSGQLLGDVGAGPSSSRGSYAHSTIGDGSRSASGMMTPQLASTSSGLGNYGGYTRNRDPGELVPSSSWPYEALLALSRSHQNSVPMDVYNALIVDTQNAFNSFLTEADLLITSISKGSHETASTSLPVSHAETRPHSHPLTTSTLPSGRAVESTAPQPMHPHDIPHGPHPGSTSMETDPSNDDSAGFYALRAHLVAQLASKEASACDDKDAATLATGLAPTPVYPRESPPECASHVAHQLCTTSLAGSGSQPGSPGFHTSASAAGSDSTFFSATSHAGSFGSQIDHSCFAPSTSTSHSPPSGSFKSSLSPIATPQLAPVPAQLPALKFKHSAPTPDTFSQLFAKQNSIRELLIEQIPCSGLSLHGLTQLRKLTILESNISPPWQPLQAMPHLCELVIEKCRPAVTDTSLLQCLTSLSRLSHLHLDLSFMRVDESVFAHVLALKKMPYLHNVHLCFGASFSPHYLRELAGWSAFKSLEARFLDMQPTHVSSLARLSQLTRLELLAELPETVSFETLEVLSRLSNVEALTWYSCPPEGMDVLTLLPRLENLTLSGLFFLKRSTLECVASLSSIKHLWLQDIVMMDDTILDTWTQLTTLQSLQLGHKEHTQLGTPHLPYIAQLTDLTALNLHGCFSLDEAAMQLLSSASSLVMLDVSWCVNIPPAGFAHLARLPLLTYLNAEGCPGVSAEAIEGLASVSRLRELWVGECNGVTVDTLRLFEGMRGLRLLDLRGCKVMQQLGPKLGFVGDLVLHAGRGVFRALDWSPFVLPWNLGKW